MVPNEDTNSILFEEAKHHLHAGFLTHDKDEFEAAGALLLQAFSRLDILALGDTLEEQRIAFAEAGKADAPEYKGKSPLLIRTAWQYIQTRGINPLIESELVNLRLDPKKARLAIRECLHEYYAEAFPSEKHVDSNKGGEREHILG